MENGQPNNMETLAVRNNNPGNLKDPSTGQFRQFTTPQEGHAALLNDLQAKITGTSTTGLNGDSTLTDFSKVYAPASDKNDPAQYTANLANKLGVRPDTKLKDLQPKIGQFAEAISQNEGYNQQSQTPSANQPTQEEQPKKEGFLTSVFRGVTAPVVTMLARPIQAGARLFGASPEEINKVSSQIPFYGENGALDVPQSGSDLLKDVGRAAETVSLGLPVKGVGQTVRAGAVMGAGSGLENNPTLEGALTGGITGGALGLAGAGLSKALDYLPTRMTQSAFKGLNPEQITQTLATKDIGTRAGLLTQSQRAINAYGGQLGTALRRPAYKNIVVNAENVLSKLADNPDIKQKLLDTGLHLDEIAQRIKRVVPLKSDLVDKFFNEGLSLPELHRLNSSLGDNTFKSALDAPVVRAGKDLASILYHGTSDYIKGLAPETAPLFDQLSKEYGVKAVLKKVAGKSTGGIIRWRDLLPALGGSAVAGPFGGLGAIAAERVAENPAVQFAAAKGIKATSKIAQPIVRRAGLVAPAINRQ